MIKHGLREGPSALSIGGKGLFNVNDGFNFDQAEFNEVTWSGGKRVFIV